MVNTKQNPIVNAQKIKRKKQKYTTKESHQAANEESKRRRNRGTRKQPENNHTVSIKQPGNTLSINNCLSIIILNVNDLNIPIIKHTMAEWIKKR